MGCPSTKFDSIPSSPPASNSPSGAAQREAAQSISTIAHRLRFISFSSCIRRNQNMRFKGAALFQAAPGPLLLFCIFILPPESVEDEGVTADAVVIGFHVRTIHR
jgi:hypothetical protein